MFEAEEKENEREGGLNCIACERKRGVFRCCTSSNALCTTMSSSSSSSEDDDPQEDELLSRFCSVLLNGVGYANVLDVTALFPDEHNETARFFDGDRQFSKVGMQEEWISTSDSSPGSSFTPFIPEIEG